MSTTEEPSFVESHGRTSSARQTAEELWKKVLPWNPVEEFLPRVSTEEGSSAGVHGRRFFRGLIS